MGRFWNLISLAGALLTCYAATYDPLWVSLLCGAVTVALVYAGISRTWDAQFMGDGDPDED